MNKTDGWIKIYRIIEQSNIWGKPSDWLKIWLYLLLEVNHNNGEGFFTWEKIEQNCHISKKQLRRFFDFAISEKMIIRKKTARGIKICVLNWEIYQHEQRALQTQKKGTYEGTPNIAQNITNKANERQSEISEGTYEGTPNSKKGHTDKQEVLQEYKNNDLPKSHSLDLKDTEDTELEKKIENLLNKFSTLMGFKASIGYRVKNRDNAILLLQDHSVEDIIQAVQTGINEYKKQGKKPSRFITLNSLINFIDTWLAKPEIKITKGEW